MVLYIGDKPVGLYKVVYRLTPTDEWQPNPNWWDIKKILDEDTRDYPGKAGVIMYNFDGVSDFQLRANGLAAVATSDGGFYTADGSAYKNITHNWDVAQDKDAGNGLKTRWIIYYYATDNIDMPFNKSSNLGFKNNEIAFLVLRANITNANSFCSQCYLLEAVDNDGYTISGDSFVGFMNYCVSLRKIPSGINTSNSTLFTNFFGECRLIEELPDNLDLSQGTTWDYFCYNCSALKRVPKTIDTRKMTRASYVFAYCYSLTSLPQMSLEGMTGTVSSTSSPFKNMRCLVEAYITLPSSTNFYLDSFTYISIESFRYIADNAPDVTDTPRTLTIGSTNITRCNTADPTIITDLNAKGWTVK